MEAQLLIHKHKMKRGDEIVISMYQFDCHRTTIAPSSRRKMEIRSKAKFLIHKQKGEADCDIKIPIQIRQAGERDAAVIVTGEIDSSRATNEGVNITLGFWVFGSVSDLTDRQQLY